MTNASARSDSSNRDDSAPGYGGSNDRKTAVRGILTYTLGLGLAVLLTVASFGLAGVDVIYGPGLPMALIALAIAQIGIHLTFFLHITTAPDNTNNIMALAFGMFIVFLVIGGSVWIMSHLSANMMLPAQAGQMAPMR